MKKIWIFVWALFLVLNSVYTQDSEETLASDDPAPQEKRWPRVISVSNAEITVYQPQLESFEKNTITGRAAVAVKRNGSDKTDYCAVWMKATVDVDKEERVVKLRDLTITKMAYPDASNKVKESLGNIIREHFLKTDLNMSLDNLLAMAEAVKKQQAKDLKFENCVWSN